MPKAKTARNRISSSHLFLMELILALLLFSVASAASVSVFVRAHKMSRRATELGRAADAASSLITIIGTRYAKKPADRKHPFGHGRAEYLSAMVISVIVLYAGITSLVESV